MAEHVTPDGELDAETNWVYAGSVCRTTTFCALDGPLLRTTRLYVRLLPAITGSGESLMLIDSDDLELVDDRGRSLLAEAVALKGGRPRVRGIFEDDLYLMDDTPPDVDDLA